MYEVLPATAPPDEDVAGLSPLPITSTAASRGSAPRLAIDGDVHTRWTTERNQQDGDWFEVDLGQLRDVVGLRLHQEDALDFPRGLTISASSDGTHRTTIREAPSLFGWPDLVHDGRSYDLDLRLPATRARWLRLEVTRGASQWWSASEITVYGPRS